MKLDAIALGLDGVWDVADTNTHTAGSAALGVDNDYTRVLHFAGIYAYTDITFNAATTRRRGGPVSTTEPYPAGSWIPGPFTVVQLAGGFGQLVAEVRL